LLSGMETTLGEVGNKKAKTIAKDGNHCYATRTTLIEVRIIVGHVSNQKLIKSRKLNILEEAKKVVEAERRIKEQKKEDARQAREALLESDPKKRKVRVGEMVLIRARCDPKYPWPETVKRLICIELHQNSFVSMVSL